MEKTQFIGLRAQMLYGAQKERDFAAKVLHASLIGFCKSQVRKYVFNISAEEVDEKATDILADILTEKLASFNEAHAYQPWISRIIHNRSVDEFRRRKSSKNKLRMDEGVCNGEGNTYKVEIQDDSKLPDESQEEDFKFTVLKDSLEAVTPKYRQVLEFLYIEELSQKEIVARTGLKRSTVGVFTFRGLKELKKLFRNRGFVF